MTRSRRETVCLRVVLTTYAVVVMVTVAFLRDAGKLLHELSSQWISFLGDLRDSGGGFSTPSISHTIEIGAFGLMVASAVLAEQFVSHFVERGWRLPRRSLWWACVFHALAALGWLVVLTVDAWSFLDRADWWELIIPVFVIAATKLTCAILVLREKRFLPDGE